jgi:hypothetical protein
METDRALVVAGEAFEISYRIMGGDGHPVTAFEELHERRMHLIVVRRDLIGFQHLHPEMASDGTWRADLLLPTGGAWRAFADFATRETATTLGVDLLAAGEFRPEPLPAAATGSEANGDEVSMRAEDGQIHFAVTRGGRPMQVEPYLGALGHLVALRWGDLAFLHTHPVGETAIVFDVSYPSAGWYRLFLQYSIEGEVRTASFTTEVSS